MVRTSRRQTLLRTTTAIDFSSPPAGEADRLTAEPDRALGAEQRIDADRLLPVLIQEMYLPQEAKDHLYQEIQRVRQCAHPSPPQPPPPALLTHMPRQAGTNNRPLCHRGSTRAAYIHSNSSSGMPWPI